MIIDIITIFPEMFTGIINASIIKRTIEKELWEIFHYTNQPEPLPLQELKLRNSTLMKELKRAKYLKDIT